MMHYIYIYMISLESAQVLGDATNLLYGEVCPLALSNIFVTFLDMKHANTFYDIGSGSGLQPTR